MKKIIIIGGGLSGLITGIQLANSGVFCTILEKKSYPLHKVCGEYISNETTPFLKRVGLYPEELNPTSIRKLQLTSVDGRMAFLPLSSGGFGISRYAYDYFLYKKALAAGVTFFLNTEAQKVSFQDGQFQVTTPASTITGDLVIGSFGKRSKVDISLGRSFIKKRSPWLGVKYHIRTEHPADLIGLHNFRNGYCGISNVEDGKTNLCYLSHRDNLKEHGNISAMEKAVLFENPFLKRIFEQSVFLWDKPETINEISFETKGPVDDHILMCGDASGMITPLCGNGMAMAIHGSMILSALAIRFCKEPNYPRLQLERDYEKQWTDIFSRRLWIGRKIQGLFGGDLSSSIAVSLANYAKPVASFLVNKTHGNPF